jgi:hypothetical protein
LKHLLLPVAVVVDLMLAVAVAPVVLYTALIMQLPLEIVIQLLLALAEMAEQLEVLTQLVLMADKANLTH